MGRARTQLLHRSPDVADAIALGLFRGATPVLISGENRDIDVGPEDVWDNGGFYSFLDVAETHTLASSSVNDTALGTGAREVRIEGLDANLDPFNQVFATNGTVGIVTPALRRVNKITVTDAGSGETNLGAISLVADISATTSAAMFIGAGSSGMAIYSVARNHALVLKQIGVEMTRAIVPGAAMADFVIKTRSGLDGSTGAVITSVRAGVSIDGGGVGTMFPQPVRIDEFTDVWVRVESVTDANTSFTALLAGTLYDLSIVTPLLALGAFLAPFLGGLKMAAASVGA